MASKIFLTGATGYVGGTVFNTLVTAHPEYEITVLLRNPPSKFSELYPKVEVLKGTFDDFDILKKAASEADIVVRKSINNLHRQLLSLMVFKYHGNSDHLAAVQALVAGVTTRAQASLPAFYIHLGGTGIIADMDNLGYLAGKVWSDIEDVDELWSLPLTHVHRETESVIHDAWSAYGDVLRTAIVCPPNIHGIGKGPGSKQSFYVPVFLQESLKYKSTFYFKNGSNIYPRTHVENVAEVFLKLVESAMAGGQGVDWNREGYYFVPSEDIPQIDIARACGGILNSRRLLQDAEPREVTLEELDNMVTYVPLPGTARLIFAANSRFTAKRASSVLGIKATTPGFLETLEEDLDYAAKIQQQSQ